MALSQTQAVFRAAVVLVAAAASSVSWGQLPAPELLSPADSAQVTLAQILNSQVILDWSDVSGAVRYAVDIHGPPGFVNLLPLRTDSQAVFNRTSIPGSYWWRVRAIDGIG